MKEYNEKNLPQGSQKVCVVVPENLSFIKNLMKKKMKILKIDVKSFHFWKKKISEQNETRKFLLNSWLLLLWN